MKNEALLTEGKGRFVLLHHVMPPIPSFEASGGEAETVLAGSVASHWDLLFETGEALVTLRLMRLPAALPEFDAVYSPAMELVAQRLPDHRKLYLEYEGPISGNRGHVSRVAGGEFHRNGNAKISLSSEKLVAEIELEACAVGQETVLSVFRWKLLK